MTGKESFSITARIRSVGYAVQGIITYLKTQHNAWIQFISAVVVIVLGVVLKVNTNEWCWLITAIALVIITEMLNTAIEFLCNFISPQIHPQIKAIKDVSAGAVLISAITAAAIGLIIFLPKVL